MPSPSAEKNTNRHAYSAEDDDVMLSAELLDSLRPQSASELPKVRQLYLALYQSIEHSQLPFNTRLPASRVLARQLNVARNTVISVYEQLIAEGLLSAEGRRGTRVVRQVNTRTAMNSSSVKLSARSKNWQPNKTQYPELAPGEPDTSLFPFAAWRKAQAVAAKQCINDLGYRAQALLVTREAIARYLLNYRSLQVHPQQIVVTASTRQSLALTAALFADPGDIAWLECPGYLGAVDAFTQLGLTVRALKLDEQGLVLPKAPTPTPRLIYTTPCFQYPFGMPLAVERREALINLSRQHGSVIFEDDYDSEFRSHTQPRPSLAADATGATVLNAGTFSKLVFPAIRLAWLVVPLSVADKANHALKVIGGGSNTIAQLTVTELLNNGTMANHLKRAKHVYSQRRMSFLEALEPSDWFDPIDYASSNLSLVLALKRHASIKELETAFAQQHLGAVPLERLNWRIKKPTRSRAIVVGLGNVDSLSIPSVVKRLKQAVKTAVRS